MGANGKENIYFWIHSDQKISLPLTVVVFVQMALPGCLQESVWFTALHPSNPANFTYTCISSPHTASTASACTWLYSVALEAEEPNYNLVSFAVQLQPAEIIHCWLSFWDKTFFMFIFIIKKKKAFKLLNAYLDRTLLIFVRCWFNISLLCW